MKIVMQGISLILRKRNILPQAEFIEGRGRGGRDQFYGNYENRNQWDDDDADNNLGSIKINMQTFQGKTDPEAYMEWESKVERIFDYHHLSEEKKVKLSVSQFTDYAIIQWDHVVTSKRRNLERKINTWQELKSLMKRICA